MSPPGIATTMPGADLDPLQLVDSDPHVGCDRMQGDTARQK